jgi:hypothetical protein
MTIGRGLQMKEAFYFNITLIYYQKGVPMAQIDTSANEYTLDTVALTVDDPELDLPSASAMAKEKARELDSNAMMLSYHSTKTGEYWPNHDCGSDTKPPWIVFAESRGYNLKIDINNGEFEFYYLRF